VFPHEDSGEKIFPAIAEVGIAKEGRKSFPEAGGKGGKEAEAKGKKGKEFYELAIRVITMVATLKKSYDALVVVALYLHPKLTHAELLRISTTGNLESDFFPGIASPITLVLRHHIILFNQTLK